MFNNYPVVTHETHRVKLDKIGAFEIDEHEQSSPSLFSSDEPQEQKVSESKGKPVSELFVTLMSSINPFAKFVIQEISEAKTNG